MVGFHKHGIAESWQLPPARPREAAGTSMDWFQQEVAKEAAKKAPAAPSRRQGLVKFVAASAHAPQAANRPAAERPVAVAGRDRPRKKPAGRSEMQLAALKSSLPP